MKRQKMAQWVCLGVLCLCVLGITEHRAQAMPSKSALAAQAHADLARYYTWLNAPWTDDDRPYARLRAKIEGSATDGAKAYSLFQAYEAAVAHDPHNPQVQFADYDAAYMADVLPGGLHTVESLSGGPRAIELRDRVGDVFYWAGRDKPPHTYNVARIVFLCSAYGFADPRLRDLGLRLVKRDPNDYYVKYHTVVVLTASGPGEPADVTRALSLAQDLVRRYPDKPAVYGILGSVYYNRWTISKRPADAILATAEFQKYLQVAPPGASYRPEAEALIAQMQKG